MNAVSQPTSEQAAVAHDAALDGSAIFQELLNKVAGIERRQAMPQVQPMELRSFDELERWAVRVQQSDLMPYGYKGKVDNIILAVQMGAELGLRPLQSLQNIAVINGKPTVFGDAMLALCMGHPLYVSTEEMIVGAGDDRKARCITIRKGTPPVIREFSVQDAKTARLWGKTGRDGQPTPWITNPDRMLQFRARGFALRDAFPDKLRGIISAEEAMDYDMDPGSTAFVSAAPSAAASPAPRQSAAPVRDPKVIKWADDACKALKTAKTLGERSTIIDKINPHLDRLRDKDEELATLITDAIAASGMRLQSAAPDANRKEYATAPKPTPPEPSAPLEYFLLDEFGEPVKTAAGEELTLPTGLQFANAFALEAAKPNTNLEALRENNADAIGDAGRDPAATLIIQAAIDSATQRAAKKAAKQPTAAAAIATGLDAAPDPDAEWAADAVAWIKKPETTYQEVLDWAMGSEPQKKMPAFKAKRPALYALVRDAIEGRKPS